MSEVNTLDHIWGYFKNQATPKEKETYLKLIERYKNKTISVTRIKSLLQKLIDQYENDYLSQSYYL
jgi:UV DNA damage endonuclease